MSAGNIDMAVAKFDATGNHIWSQSFGDTEIQEARGVATDSAGNVTVTGRFRGTVDFGGGPLSSALFGSHDIFVAKFDSSGSHLWSHGFGDTQNQWGRSVAVDALDNLILTGWFQGTVDFGGAVLTSGGDDDIFLAKFDSAGGHLWSQNFGGTGSQNGWDVAVDSSDNVTVTGYFRESADFGGGVLTSAGRNDVFIARFNPAGTHLWSANYGDDRHQYAYGVEITGAGQAFVTGSFEGTVDFGGGPLTSVDQEDTFLARFSLGAPTGVTETPSAGLRLELAYPSPFHLETAISFELGSAGIVEVVVYDIAGRRVATLLHGHRTVGGHTVTWNGRDDAGHRVRSGVYFVRLKSRDGARVRKLTLLR